MVNPPDNSNLKLTPEQKKKSRIKAKVTLYYLEIEHSVLKQNWKNSMYWHLIANHISLNMVKKNSKMLYLCCTHCKKKASHFCEASSSLVAGTAPKRRGNQKLF